MGLLDRIVQLQKKEGFAGKSWVTSPLIKRFSKSILRLAKQSIPAFRGDWKVKIGKKSSKPLKIKSTFILRR